MKFQGYSLAAAAFATPTILAASVPSSLRYCTLPVAGAAYESVPAAALNIDQDILNKAVGDANPSGKLAIQVFRNNCLLSTNQTSALTDQDRKNLFSAAKGVIGILTGIAFDQGKLKLDDPIDKYLPSTAGWGDAAHRAITIRQLLQETAGLDKGVFSEGITFLLDPSLPQQALAMKFVTPAGEAFQYSQRVPDLLAYVVSRAVGQELQAFAQANLFTPLGIAKTQYIWFKDNSGNSYGYAHLYLTPDNFARLGLMMQNGGVYSNSRVLSQTWVDLVSVPSEHNGCYGMLFWTNRGDTCISPTGYPFQRSWLPSAPRDLFAMSGSPQQKNFMIPSLNMTVSWMEVTPGKGPPADIWYKFFKTLMPGVRDLPPFDPKTYEMEPSGLNATLEALSLSVLLGNLLSSPQCNIVICNADISLLGILGWAGSFEAAIDMIYDLLSATSGRFGM
ncbi:uncharacterized protein RCO7_05475 [Rhynchosporium graminicola]|uniref:Beta-lactamase-related domain-containing protein n=1 Tax=Rhynchosporium graminicola TaxID=2792576 RepID=A0A1E1KV37_9HELO|nr:uncharacterized protein RCO7_05475 [Rhynchosporium commune]